MGAGVIERGDMGDGEGGWVMERGGDGEGG